MNAPIFFRSACTVVSLFGISLITSSMVDKKCMNTRFGIALVLIARSDYSKTKIRKKVID
jgi:hypothetical protein